MVLYFPAHSLSSPSQDQHGQLAWASYSFIPGFPEQFVRAVHQFVELLFIQS